MEILTCVDYAKIYGMNAVLNLKGPSLEIVKLHRDAKVDVSGALRFSAPTCDAYQCLWHNINLAVECRLQSEDGAE